MKIAFLLPRVHFYAPLAIKPLLAEGNGLEVRAFLTPKLEPDESFLEGMRRLIRKKGLRYLLELTALRLIYRLLDEYESRVRKPPEQRRWPEVRSLLDLHDIPFEEISSLQSPYFERAIKDFAPDVLFSVFFNQIVPRSVFEYPSRGSFNLHPGRLPEFRGHSPVFYQLLEDAEEAGCALHELTDRLDAGDIYEQASVEVRDQDTVHSLYRRLALKGSELLVELVDALRSDASIQTTPQDEASAREYEDFSRENLRQLRKSRDWWRYHDFRRDSCNTT